jgi:hypothetical protein
MDSAGGDPDGWFDIRQLPGEQYESYRQVRPRRLAGLSGPYVILE